MYANKGNKQCRLLSDADKQEYLAQGYDIIDESGEVVEYSRLKSIPYGQYERLKAENAALLARIAELDKPPESLKDLTLDELTDYAAKQNIDIGQAKSHGGVLEKILAARSV